MLVPIIQRYESLLELEPTINTNKKFTQLAGVKSILEVVAEAATHKGIFIVYSIYIYCTHCLFIVHAS